MVDKQANVFNPKSRFYFLDALRGFAALAVVFFHLYGNLKNEVSNWFPASLGIVLEHGYLGVPVFFVISGFVITHSVSCSQINPSYIGRFALRRAIRLDPPYWAMIAISISLIFIENKYFGTNKIIPKPNEVFSHLFYLQDILGYHPISSVFWTLCLEVQLYLSYILLSWISIIICKYIAGINFSEVHSFILIGLGTYSIASYLGLVATGPTGSFIQFWHFFLLGYLAYKSIETKNSNYYKIYISYVIVLSLYTKININVIASMVTSFVIILSGRNRFIYTGFNNFIFQYFGIISYSLYLSHAEIGWKVISLIKRFLYSDANQLNFYEFIIAFLCGIIASVVVAHLLYRFIELPSNRLSKTLKKSTSMNKATRVVVATE